MRLTTRILVLVAFALLPAVAVQGYNEVEQRRTRERQMRAQALTLAHGVASDLDRVAEGIRQVLVALAELPVVRSKDPQGCSEYLGRIGQRYPGYLLIGANDAEGWNICGSTGAPPHTVASGERATFRHAMASGRFSMGDHVAAGTAGRRSLHFALPFQDSAGGRGGVVMAGLDLDWMALYLSSTGRLPEGAALTVTDRQGTVLLHVPDEPPSAGRPLPASLRAALASTGSAGVVERLGLDDRARVFGVTTPGGNLQGLTVAVGLSREAAFAQIDRASRRGLWLIVLGAVLALLYAWVAGRELIRKPVAALVGAAERWGQGDFAARTHLVDGSSELHRLGSAFDRMAGDLARREQDLREANDRLRAEAAEHEEAQRRELLLLREVDHRAKNTLAMAQSLMRLTQAEDIAHYVDKVQGRIAALSHAHQLLARNGWEGADLREVVEEELSGLGDRVRLEGSSVRLAAEAVQPLGLILHELASNAVRHGALSVPQGRIEVAWSEVPASSRLRLTWCEHGGPPVTAPPPTEDPPVRGSGSRLIRDAAVQQLKGRITFDWHLTGLCFALDLPEEDLTPKPRLAHASWAPPT